MTMSSRASRRGQNLLAWLLCSLLTLALYWRTIPLPYFWDDVVHFDFATSRTFLQVWTNVTGLPYYRPVVFTLYKIFFELQTTSQPSNEHSIERVDAQAEQMWQPR